MAKGKHSADRGYFSDQKMDADYDKKYGTRYDTKTIDKNEEIIEEQETNSQNFFEDNSYYEEYDDEPRISKIKIICCIVIVVLIVGIAWFITHKSSNQPDETIVEETNTVGENRLISTYENYNVIGKIRIDSIGVEQYILDSTEEDALQYGVIKLYGGSLNNYGNLCLAGHNFDNIFGKLNELDKGDIITLIDTDLSEIEYEVKAILSVDPTNLNVLLPDEEIVEITLITCENGSTQRLIIKAEEKK